MKISKNSWHYKLATDDKFGTYEHRISHSLCIYFWQVVKPLCGALLLSLFFASILFCMLVAPFIAMIIGVWVPESGIALGVFVGGLLWLTLMGYVFMEIIIPKLKSKFSRKKPSAGPKKPNIVIEYIKANKAKICPVIEFEGE